MEILTVAYSARPLHTLRELHDVLINLPMVAPYHIVAEGLLLNASSKVLAVDDVAALRHYVDAAMSSSRETARECQGPDFDFVVRLPFTTFCDVVNHVVAFHSRHESREQRKQTEAEDVLDCIRKFSLADFDFDDQQQRKKKKKHRGSFAGSFGAHSANFTGTTVSTPVATEQLHQQPYVAVATQRRLSNAAAKGNATLPGESGPQVGPLAQQQDDGTLAEVQPSRRGSMKLQEQKKVMSTPIATVSNPHAQAELSRIKEYVGAFGLRLPTGVESSLLSEDDLHSNQCQQSQGSDNAPGFLLVHQLVTADDPDIVAMKRGHRAIPSLHGTGISASKHGHRDSAMDDIMMMDSRNGVPSGLQSSAATSVEGDAPEYGEVVVVPGHAVFTQMSKREKQLRGLALAQTGFPRVSMSLGRGQHDAEAHHQGKRHSVIESIRRINERQPRLRVPPMRDGDMSDSGGSSHESNEDAQYRRGERSKSRLKKFYSEELARKGRGTWGHIYTDSIPPSREKVLQYYLDMKAKRFSEAERKNIYAHLPPQKRDPFALGRSSRSETLPPLTPEEERRIEQDVAEAMEEQEFHDEARAVRGHSPPSPLARKCSDYYQVGGLHRPKSTLQTHPNSIVEGIFNNCERRALLGMTAKKIAAHRRRVVAERAKGR